MQTSSPELNIRPGDCRAARAVLTYVADPADPLLGGLLQAVDPCEIVAAIQSGTLPGAVYRQLNPGQQARIGPALMQWRLRLAAVPARTALGSPEARDVNLLCPGDPGWPGQLDNLGLARPYALWVRGTVDLRDLCGQSVAVVGSRAATAYGTQMCAEITAGLSASNWVIVSGGAYGIDVTAHRAALACGGRTVAVLACGPDLACPREHTGLFDNVAGNGAVVSEYPPGALPARHRFLIWTNESPAGGVGLFHALLLVVAVIRFLRRVIVDVLEGSWQAGLFNQLRPVQD
jgi:DNA processing protein